MTNKEMLGRRNLASVGKTRKKNRTSVFSKVWWYKNTWSFIRAVIILGLCFIILRPFMTKLGISFMAERDLYDSSIRYVPKTFTTQNYKLALESMQYHATFLRTFFLSFSTAFLQLFSTLLTAYAFARFRFPGKNILFAGVIFMLIVPPQVNMLPLFMRFRFFDVFGIVEAVRGTPINLIDTPWPNLIQGITATGFKNGLYIYMLRQFFRGMPKELEEAAFVDGYGRFQTFLKIMLPSAVSMMVTVFLFGFVWQWTDSFYTSMYLPTWKVMSGAMSGLAAEVSNKYQEFGGGLSFVSPGFTSIMNNTATVLVVLPLIVLYVFCQKYFVESIANSGIVA